MQWQISTITTSKVTESKPNKTTQKQKQTLELSAVTETNPNKTKQKKTEKSKNNTKQKTNKQIPTVTLSAGGQQLTDRRVRTSSTRSRIHPWGAFLLEISMMLSSHLKYVCLVLAFVYLCVCVFMHLFVLVFVCTQSRIHPWGKFLT